MYGEHTYFEFGSRMPILNVVRIHQPDDECLSQAWISYLKHVMVCGVAHTTRIFESLTSTLKLEMKSHMIAMSNHMKHVMVP